jgi:hypothetical protein
VTTLARCTFTTLALNAKVHSMLNRVGERQAKRHTQTHAQFEGHLTKAVDALKREERLDGAAQRRLLLRDIDSEIDAVQAAYDTYKKHAKLDVSQRERFEMVFASLRAKIREKERALSA